MKPKRPLFYLEFKRLTSGRNLVIMVIFFALLMLMAQAGIGGYKEESKEVAKNNETEKLKVQQFEVYTPYSVYGIRLFTMPSPLDFLRALNIYRGLTAAVDTGTKLDLYESRKGNSIFPDLTFGIFNFPVFLLLFGSVLVMMVGYGAYNDESYLKFLDSMYNFPKVFLVLLLSRMILVSLFIVALSLGTIILAYANGVNIVNPYFFAFVLLILLVMNCFLFVGTFAGALRKKKARIIAFICLFFFINFLAPWVIGKLVGSISNMISEHQTEYQKLKTLMAFERKGDKKFGSVRSGEEVKKFMDSYLENELEIYEDIERLHKEELLAGIETFQSFSNFFPSTFYLSSLNEISGKGYDNFIKFYGLAEKMKRGFTKFYFEKEYFSDPKPKPGQVESYIRGDENIFPLRESLPGNFVGGIIMTLIYSAVFIFLSYRFTSRKVYQLKERLENEDDVYARIKKNEPNVFFTRSNLVKAKTYNYISGKEKLKGEIAFYPDEEVEPPGKINFLWLGESVTLNSLNPHVLHCYLFGEEPGKNMETADVLFKFALLFKVVFFDEFLKNIDLEKINDLKLQLVEKEIFSLVFTSDHYFTLVFVDNADNMYYLKNDHSASVLSKQLKNKGSQKK